MAYTPPLLETPVILCEPCNEPVVVTSYELILQSPYTEPSPYLLVLRSRPDVAPITGTLTVASGGDIGAWVGRSRSPYPPITATFAPLERRDTAVLNGSVSIPIITGTFGEAGNINEAKDTALLTGEALALAPRVGVLAANESPDNLNATIFEGVFTPKWRLVLAATGAPDTSTLQGAFEEYTGPGFFGSTERKDTAAFVGRSVYDIAITFGTSGNINEAPDSVVIIADTAREIEAEVLTDTLVFSDAVVGDVDSTTLRDTAIFSDALGDVALTLVDVVVFSDGLTSRSDISGAVSETWIFSDTPVATPVSAISDTVVFADTLSSDATDTDADRLRDSVLWTDVCEGQADFSSSLSDTVIFGDAVDAMFLADSTDTVVFADELAGSVVAFAALTDTVLWTDTADGTLTVYANLTDTVIVTDALNSSLTLVGVLSDTVLFGDSLHEAAQTVYVINAETGATSTYTLTPTITGLAEYRGILYLAGPEGLYALDADQDEDGSVVWTLRTGFSNLGTDKLKRVQDCNFQARTDGDTTFQTVADRYGAKQEWNYRLPPLTRDSYRDGVVKVGRGVQSVYWQFAAQGVGPAEIDQLRLVVEPLSRRR